MNARGSWPTAGRVPVRPVPAAQVAAGVAVAVAAVAAGVVPVAVVAVVAAVAGAVAIVPDDRPPMSDADAVRAAVAIAGGPDRTRRPAAPARRDATRTAIPVLFDDLDRRVAAVLAAATAPLTAADVADALDLDRRRDATLALMTLVVRGDAVADRLYFSTPDRR